MTFKVTDKWMGILNIRPAEGPRVLLGWIITFLLRFGFVMGWTVLVAQFLGQIGQSFLPWLFFLHALAMMGGAIFFQGILKKSRPEEVLMGTAFLGSFILLFCLSFEIPSYLFIACLLFVESIVMGQVMILSSLFKEELFSPLESQRTLPLIESAETVGGIAAGFLLSSFSHHLPLSSFLAFWSLSLFVLIPLVLFFKKKKPEFKKFSSKITVIPKGYRNFSEMKSLKFLKTLMLVVCLHWAIAYLIEYQYTRAIEFDVLQHLGAHKEQFEAALTQKLGELQLLFSGAAFFVQLLLSGRILSSLGVTWSLLLNHIVNFLGVFLMSFRFNLLLASSTKGSFEITRLIFKNGYDALYYAIPRTARGHVKEIMEGVMKPLGVLLSTGLLFLIAKVVPESQQNLVINVGILFFIFLSVHTTLSLNQGYTYMGEYNLSKKMDLGTRLNAVEILAQKGHFRTSPALYKLFTRDNEPNYLKIKILETLGVRKDENAIGLILKTLKHSEADLRLAAIEALCNFKDLKKKDQFPFTVHRIEKVVSEVLLEEKEETLRARLGEFYYAFSPEKAIEFFMHTVQKDETRRAAFIRLMKHFKDPHLFYYLESYLTSKSPQIRAATIITLWPMEEYRKTLIHTLRQMLKSRDEEILLEAIEVCGEVEFFESKAFLHSILEKEENKKIERAALIALAQMEEDRIIPHLVRNFLNIGHQLAKLPKKFREKLETALHLHITQRLHEVLGRLTLETMTSQDLKHLYELKEHYQRINAHHEVTFLEEIIAHSEEHLNFRFV